MTRRRWRCPQCGWHTDTIAHPSVTITHRCNNGRRRVALVPDDTEETTE